MKSIKTWGTLSLLSAAFFSLPAMSQNSSKLSDPEIASVAVVANQIDIDYATIAKKKSKNSDVLKFAETMAKDHQSVIDQAVALVTRLGVKPQDNATSKSLLAGAVKTKKMLNARSGNAFDKAYINNEVSYHKAVISTVEKVLIPDSENKDLKSLLQTVLPILKTHLEHAEMVQKTLSANGK